MRAVALWSVMILAVGPVGAGETVVPPVSQRFADGKTDEVPHFQKHVAPLFGRLGCNGRACHGSFQGRGGFRLTLFGYELDTDYEALLDPESPRIDLKDPAESLILVKPTDEEMHEGGKRYEVGSWEYHVLRKWIEAGAPHEKGKLVTLKQLVVEPPEIRFSAPDETVRLRVIAVWEDGTREEVTPLCRFQSNDDQMADVTAEGIVRCRGTGDTHVVVFYDKAVVPVPVMRPVSRYVGPLYPDVETPTKIDELVVARLKKLGIIPSPVTDDVTFLRRVSLDLTGTLPSPEEIRAFLNDSSPDKRAAKIEELLETPAYAAWWTTRLCDWTGNSEAQLINVVPGKSAAQDWYDWIYRRVERNVPYDEIVEGIVLGTSREEGETYRQYCEKMSQIYGSKSGMSFADRSTLPHFWARRNFRSPDDRVVGFAYSFLGVRIQCAQCHKHPFDQWSKDDFAQFRGFFQSVVYNARGSDPKEYRRLIESLGLDPNTRGGELRRELIKRQRKGEVVPFPEVYVATPKKARQRGKGKRARPGRNRTAKLLGAEVVDLSEYRDPRVVLMDWLRRPDNPYFAKAFVNRVWASYFGRGIVEPPDDLNLANPPSNGPLLDYLAKGFIEHGYDMKWLHRTILLSDTYQRDWRPNETNLHDQRHFSRAIPRRLEAEQVFDAVLAATANTARNRSMKQDLQGRAIAVPGPPRNARRDPLNYSLTVFGRSTRESNCDCDRSSDPNLLQVVYLQNDTAVLTRIRNGGWVAEVAGRPAPSQANAKAKAKAMQAAKRRAQNLQKRLTQVQKQLRAARRSPAKRKQAARLQRQVTEIRKALAKVEKQIRPKQSKTAAKSGLKWSLSRAIEDAYLRTLSRPPSREEAAIATEFIGESKTPAEGIEGLLWALINTKEFIVNH